jgi:hypothetical protein
MHQGLGVYHTFSFAPLCASPSLRAANSVTIIFSGTLTEYDSLFDGIYDFWIDAAQVRGQGGALDGDNDGVPGGSYHLVGTTANRFF